MYKLIIIAQYLGIILLAVECLYAVLQKTSKTQLIVVCLTLSAMISLMGYLLELQATAFDTAYMGVKIGYLGKPFVLLASFLFVTHFYGYTIPRPILVGMFILHAFITVIVFTNDYHHLYYSSVAYDATAEFGRFTLGKGPIYVLYMAMTAGYMVANMVIASREYKKVSTNEEKVQTLYLFGMVASGIIGYAIYLSGLTDGYDSTMIGMFVGTLFLFILFSRYRLFDILTLVKDKSLQSASYGLIIRNHRGDVVYKNRMVDSLLSDGVDVMGAFDTAEDTTRLSDGDRVFAARRTDVNDRGRYFGKTLEIVDITDSHNNATRLEREVDDRTAEITHIQRTIISRLAFIVEARDSVEGSHTKSATEQVRLIATELYASGTFEELTHDYMTGLIDVSPLHDIGKITVSDDILNKPSALTDAEFEQVKAHTTQGARIIEDTMRGVETDEYVTMAETVALYHHERWDGSGYPQGLSGTDIPLCARIMAVADVYDALLSHRIWRVSHDRPTALSIIAKGRGTQFDADVVDALLRIEERANS